MKSFNGTLTLNVPTWTAYNSLICDPKATTMYCGLPVLQRSPTDWLNLLYSLKNCPINILRVAERVIDPRFASEKLKVNR